METKKCSCCGEIKVDGLFVKSRNECKSCRNEKRREYYKSNRSKFKGYYEKAKGGVYRINKSDSEKKLIKQVAARDYSSRNKVKISEWHKKYKNKKRHLIAGRQSIETEQLSDDYLASNIALKRSSITEGLLYSARKKIQLFRRIKSLKLNNLPFDKEDAMYRIYKTKCRLIIMEIEYEARTT